MILSGSLHSTARPVLLVVTFPTQVYSNKSAQLLATIILHGAVD